MWYIIIHFPTYLNVKTIILFTYLNHHSFFQISGVRVYSTVSIHALILPCSFYYRNWSILRRIVASKSKQHFHEHKVFRILLLKTNFENILDGLCLTRGTLVFIVLNLAPLPIQDVGFLVVTFLTDMLVGIIQRRKTDTLNIP